MRGRWILLGLAIAGVLVWVSQRPPALRPAEVMPPIAHLPDPFFTPEPTPTPLAPLPGVLPLYVGTREYRAPGLMVGFVHNQVPWTHHSRPLLDWDLHSNYPAFEEGEEDAAIRGRLTRERRAARLAEPLDPDLELIVSLHPGPGRLTEEALAAVVGDRIQRVGARCLQEGPGYQLLRWGTASASLKLDPEGNVVEVHVRPDESGAARCVARMLEGLDWPATDGTKAWVNAYLRLSRIRR